MPPVPGLWWCYADDWPPPGGVERTYYLNRNYLLDTTTSSHELSYEYDPLSPAPTICGRFFDPRYAGFCDVHTSYDTGIDSEKDQVPLVATNTIITGNNTFLVLPVYEEFSCNPLLQNLPVHE